MYSYRSSMIRTCRYLTETIQLPAPTKAAHVPDNEHLHQAFPSSFPAFVARVPLVVIFPLCNLTYQQASPQGKVTIYDAYYQLQIRCSIQRPRRRSRGRPKHARYSSTCYGYIKTWTPRIWASRQDETGYLLCSCNEIRDFPALYSWAYKTVSWLYSYCCMYIYILLTCARSYKSACCQIPPPPWLLCGFRAHDDNI